MTDKSCADRIADHKASREEYVRTLLDIANGTADTDDDGLFDGPDGDRIDQGQAQDAIYEIPLAVEVVRVLRIDLSTGGPADYLTATLDGASVQAVTYHFADWFDHAQTELDDSSPLWTLAEFYADTVDQ